MIFTEDWSTPCRVGRKKKRGILEHMPEHIRRIAPLQSGSYILCGPRELPQVPPFTGDLPESFRPMRSIVLSAKRPLAPGEGVSTFDDDSTLWARCLPGHERVLKILEGCPCVMAPDFTLGVDVHSSYNMLMLFLNRAMANYWHDCGIPILPTASWGGYDSLPYAFDGLPSHSPIAISHGVVGRHWAEKQLFRAAVERLVATRRPAPLVVYGFELPFSVDCDVCYYPSFIERLRSLGKGAR